MLETLLALLISAAGQPGCEMGALCSTSTFGRAEARINLALTLTPTMMGEVDVQQVDQAFAGVYRIDLHHMEVNSPNHHDDRKSYLVLDDFGMLDEQPIMVAFHDQVELELPLTVIALEWPQGMTKDQVFALYELDLGTRQTMLAGF